MSRFSTGGHVPFVRRLLALVVAVLPFIHAGCGRDVVGNATNDVDADGYERIIDCDDTDPSINPGANEIPYDGVDQNCDGYDFYDPGSFEIAGARGQQLAPHVAFGSSSYLVVWRDHRPTTRYATYGQLVDTDGSLIGNNFSIHDDADYPRAAFDGVNYLVVFSHFVFTHHEILGQFVSQDGRLVGGAIPICMDSNPISLPDLAFGGDNYLVAWREENDSIYAGNFLHARTVHTDGSLGEKFLVQDRSSSSFNLVSSDKVNFLIVWRDYDESDGSDTITAQVILAEGALSGEPLVVSNYPTKKVPGDVGFDGENYLVVFHGDDDELSRLVMGQFVSPEGELLFSQGNENIMISDSMGYKTSPMLTYLNGFFLAAWRDHRWENKCAIYSQKLTKGGSLFDTESHVNNLVLAPRRYPLGESVASDGRDAILVWLQHMGEAQEDVYGLMFTP